jgi:hypothetical protein
VLASILILGMGWMHNSSSSPGPSSGFNLGHNLVSHIPTNVSTNDSTSASIVATGFLWARPAPANACGYRELGRIGPSATKLGKLAFVRFQPELTPAGALRCEDSASRLNAWSAPVAGVCDPGRGLMRGNGSGKFGDCVKSAGCDNPAGFNQSSGRNWSKILCRDETAPAKVRRVRRPRSGGSCPRKPGPFEGKS